MIEATTPYIDKKPMVYYGSFSIQGGWGFSQVTAIRDIYAAGDKNVFSLDERALMALCEYNSTLDNVHPTDRGFLSMAKSLGDLIEKITLWS